MSHTRIRLKLLVNKFIYSFDEGEWNLIGQDTLYHHGNALDSMICFLIDGKTKYCDRKFIYQFMDNLLVQDAHADDLDKSEPINSK